MPFKIATWNVNSITVRLPQVLDWLALHQPDILALQETKIPNELFPWAEINKAGYQCVFNGQKTYNGTAILSKESCIDIVTDIPLLEDHQRRVLGATVGDIRILNLYVPNGQSVTSEKYVYKLNWLKHLHDYLQSEAVKYPKMILLGDFNIAPEGADVHDPAEWAGQVLFSDPERAALKDIFSLGFSDCFRLHPQPEKVFSWWDYRLNSFKRNRGLRIDHILASLELANVCKRCEVDKTPRTTERPSDHAVVFAEFD